MGNMPSPGYTVTVRVEVPSPGSTTAELAVAVGRAGGNLTALDVAGSRPDRLLVDVTFDASNADHADAVVAALETIDGVKVLKVSDRTFLLHLGGKLEVVPKVPLKHRDDLSRAYTPGVARVCLAIAKQPADLRRLTIKRNTVAVVTDGPAVLGLGDIGPAAALPVMEGKAAYPEVDPFEARRYAAVLATGRSDFPNQINNVLAFPGVFRGLLDAGAKHFSDEMELAAAQAIADAVGPEELNASYIIPSVFDPAVSPAVATAVRRAVGS
jgi:malic enzyme